MILVPAAGSASLPAAVESKPWCPASQSE